MGLIKFLKGLFSKKKSYSWDSLWSAFVKMKVSPHLSYFDDIQDIKDLHPKWHDLSKETKLDLIAALFKWIAFYESGWNPRSEAIDVGSKSDRDTWSVGLMQVSVCDQKNYKVFLDLEYDDLLKPLPNLELAIAIFLKQIKEKKKICIPKPEPGVYWAVIRPGGIFDRSNLILNKSYLEVLGE